MLKSGVCIKGCGYELYEKLVNDIVTAICSGGLASGEKLSFVRQACLNHKLSLATVFLPYYELENLGLLRAQPKSGYYVSNHAIKQLPSKTILAPEHESTAVSISDMVFSILSSIKHPETVPLWPTFPCRGCTRWSAFLSHWSVPRATWVPWLSSSHCRWATAIYAGRLRAAISCKG